MYRYVDAGMLRLAARPSDPPIPCPDLDGVGADAVHDRLRWLRDVWSDDWFHAAVELASPALAARTRTLIDAIDPCPRSVRRACASTLRYLLRSRSRATPFGLFGRRELSVLAVSRLLRAAGLDWYEQGDVWARVAESRTALSGCTVSARAPAAVRRLLTLDTGPRSALVSDGPLTAVRTWLAGFDEAGTRLGELARLGRLTRGLRAVLAHHVVFHWNRLALPPQDQLTLAVLAREALLPATDDAS